jgi:hypothetical protein
VFKKDLTGPALLEMDGNSVNWYRQLCLHGLRNKPQSRTVSSLCADFLRVVVTEVVWRNIPARNWLNLDRIFSRRHTQAEPTIGIAHRFELPCARTDQDLYSGNMRPRVWYTRKSMRPSIGHPRDTLADSKRKRSAGLWTAKELSVATLRPHLWCFRDLTCRRSACLLDLHDRIVVRLPGRDVHLFTREQATALGPVDFEIARLNLVDLDSTNVASDA